VSATLDPADFPAVQDLPRKPASEVKSDGWPATVREAQDFGKLLVTNHNRPEAVILAVREYEKLVQLARQSGEQMERALVNLQGEYDRRLSLLDEKGAAGKLRSIRGPAKLRGKVKAGTRY
jgi:prevent-host-death family protein